MYSALKLKLAGLQQVSKLKTSGLHPHGERGGLVLIALQKRRVPKNDWLVIEQAGRGRAGMKKERVKLTNQNEVLL